MDKELLEKLAYFLQYYRDVYGDEFVVDARHIEKLEQQLPPLFTAPSHSPVKPTTGKESMPVKPKPRTQTVFDPESKPHTPLWDFMRSIRNCQKCALGKSRKHFVFGDGNEHADIMFIGEAPGADEDRTGIPFVGRAGKLLDKLLAHIQLKRSDVFIANILKCRPPNNRDPLPGEVQQCIPYLYTQIEMIQPKIIVALGRVAAQNLLGTNSSLKQMRGRLWQYRGVDMIVTYHPAAILRNGGLLNPTLEDFKFLAERYREKLKRNVS